MKNEKQNETPAAVKQEAAESPARAGDTSGGDEMKIPATTTSSVEQPQLVTISADDLSRLLTEAENRGYNRASQPSESDNEAGLYEEPDSIGGCPAGWKTSPLLSSRRGSIWDR